MVVTRSGRDAGGARGRSAADRKGEGDPGPAPASPSAALPILAGSAALKVLMFPLYRSTDFEVHRNWLAITHSLPISEWYVDRTSEWTLDYPPLFAWFEWVLSQVARLVDPAMLEVANLDYASEATVAFQRTTVIVTELVLMLAVHLHCERLKMRGASRDAVFMLVSLSPGLLIVDHIHFQYNGLLLGVLMLSLEALQRDAHVLSALLFASLVNMKHLFAIAGPYYLVYMLRRHCRGTYAVRRFFGLGAAVASVCALSFAPFIRAGRLADVLARLFPFGRGLCHAYWAPNFWAAYSFADKVLCKVLPRLGLAEPLDDDAVGRMTGGLVGVSQFGVLPQIGPAACMACVLLAMAPCLVRVWAKPDPRNVLRDVAYVNLCGFIFGYHVHEKAVLHFIVPMAFLAASSGEGVRAYVQASWPAFVSLLPLLHRGPQEIAIKHVLVLLHGWYVGGMRGAQRMGRLTWVYIGALGAVQIYDAIGHRMLFGSSRFEFLPLMAYSVASAVGLLCVWAREFARYLRAPARRGRAP